VRLQEATSTVDALKAELAQLQRSLSEAQHSGEAKAAKLAELLRQGEQDRALIEQIRAEAANEKRVLSTRVEDLLGVKRSVH
jgi:chromosome segregation ATPase